MRDDTIPTIREVQEAASRRFGVPVLDLVSQRRGQPATKVRHIAMWLCRHSTLHSLKEIGRAFGDRDHTTVIHAIRRVDERIAADPDVAADLGDMRHRLNAGDSGDSVQMRRGMMRLVA